MRTLPLGLQVPDTLQVRAAELNLTVTMNYALFANSPFGDNRFPITDGAFTLEVRTVVGARALACARAF
eukprot:2476195-Pleurochrysis_carterae.AAC.1